MKEIVFISWEGHQRTRSLCGKLQIPLEEIITRKTGFSRYIECSIRTLKLIKRYSPRTLLIQNPSIVLAILALTFRLFFKYKLIVDAHNEAIVPLNFNNVLVRLIARSLIRWSDLTLVTNTSLAKIVSKNSGRAFVLPDFLPQLDFEPLALELDDHQTFYATLISTYAPDEPYLEVFKAVNSLGDRIQLSVTGKIPALLNRQVVPPNVKLTGYLSEDDYWKTLNNSHLVIDLTSRDNCLVCGAYEAIALKKPLLLSKNAASVELFGQCALHTLNSAEKIKEAIAESMTNYDVRRENISLATAKFRLLEKQRVADFLKELDHE